MVLNFLIGGHQLDLLLANTHKRVPVVWHCSEYSSRNVKVAVVVLCSVKQRKKDRGGQTTDCEPHVGRWYTMCGSRRCVDWAHFCISPIPWSKMVGTSILGYSKFLVKNNFFSQLNQFASASLPVATQLLVQSCCLVQSCFLLLELCLLIALNKIRKEIYKNRIWLMFIG